jgi:hypothetical protein
MDFDKIAFQATRAETQLTSFKAWMPARPYFSETEVVKQIAARPHMACLLGYTILMPAPDLIKFEFGIKGLFRADLAIGNDKSRKFVLIEFEDGQENSLFKGETKKYRYWSPRLEHGFGQVVDWGWAKHSHPTDVVFTNSFGGKVLDDCYVVVCGRNPPAGSLEEQRFDFRRSRLRLSGVPVQFYTYDTLVDAMSDNLAVLLAR